MANKHTLTSFEEALEKVKSDVARMAALTQRSLDNVTKGLFEGDIECCNSAIADDEEIDQLEVQVAHDGVEVLMRFQPVAIDLRQVVGAMRLCGDLERVADQAVNVARKTRKLELDQLDSEKQQLRQMFDHALAMLRDATKSYFEANQYLAGEIAERDHALDDMNSALTDQATEAMGTNPKRVRDFLAIVLIARHIERIGDHAKNIAENAIYVASDEDIRHAKKMAASQAKN